MKEVVRDVGPALTGPQGGENAGCLPGTVCSISKRCCLWKCRNVWRKRKKKKNTSMRPIPTTPGDTGQRCFPSGPSLGRTRALGATSMCFP